MVGQDQRTSWRQTQAFAYWHTFGFQLTDLFDQRFRRKHHTITNHAGFAWAQNARWNQVKNGLFTVDDQRMTRVMATLKTHHGGCGFSQQVNDFTLAFVTPLGAQHYDILTHYDALVSCVRAVGCQRPSISSRRRSHSCSAGPVRCPGSA